MMIYRIIEKINSSLYQKNIKNKIKFTDKNAYKSSIIQTGVKIYNKNVKLGSNVKLYHNVIIFGSGDVTIGDGTIVGYNTVIYASKQGGVHIGKNCAIAANSYIIDTNHSTDSLSFSIQERDYSECVVIGDNVWISANCVIALGTKLGDNVIVGANSFVNNKYDNNSIIFGSPAKLIRYRGEDLR